MLRVLRENAVLSDARLRDIQNSHTKSIKELMKVFSPRKDISVGNTTNVHIEASSDAEPSLTPEAATASKLGRLAKTALIGAAIAGTLGTGAIIPLAMNYFDKGNISQPAVTESQETDLYEYLENRGLNRIDDE